MIFSQKFPGPWPYSKTFQVWKFQLLNSITFHDFPDAVRTLLTYDNYERLLISKKIYLKMRSQQD